jgi:hypothetical protein
MNAPPSIGLPYGSYPRLALAWLSTEAVRTRNREIELGPTFSSFMYKLGLTPVTGKRGTTSRLRNQLHRLFSTTIRCSYSDEAEGHALHHRPQPPALVVAPRSRATTALELGRCPKQRVL